MIKKNWSEKYFDNRNQKLPIFQRVSRFSAGKMLKNANFQLQKIINKVKMLQQTKNSLKNKLLSEQTRKSNFDDIYLKSQFELQCKKKRKQLQQSQLKLMMLKNIQRRNQLKQNILISRKTIRLENQNQRHQQRCFISQKIRQRIKQDQKEFNQKKQLCNYLIEQRIRRYQNYIKFRMNYIKQVRKSKRQQVKEFLNQRKIKKIRIKKFGKIVYKINSQNTNLQKSINQIQKSQSKNN